MGRDLVGLLFILLGGVHALWPEKTFKFRAKIYKKMYGISMTGTKRTYRIYQFLGVMFILVGFSFFV